MANQKIEALEGRFAAQANSLHERFLDLNASMSDVSALAKGIMNMRNQLMTMYGVPVDANWNPATCATPGAAGAAMAPAAAGGGGGGGREEASYKMLLNQTAAKEKKMACGKDDFIYSVTGDAKEGGFSCIVSSPKFLNKDYSTSSLHPNKKAAEQAAAQAALQAEYPAAYASAGNVGGGGGQKRKAESAGAAGPNTKMQINQLLQVVLRGQSQSLGKDDIVFQTTDNGDKTYISTLTFPNYDATAAFQGSASISKKEAEQSAAEAALPWLSGLAASVETVQKAKKQKQGNPRAAQAPKQPKAGALPAPVFAAKTPGAQRPMGQNPMGALGARGFSPGVAQIAAGYGGGFW